jgi:hypothetical protein
MAKISKPYHGVGRGLIDRDLINEIGYALLTRCESIIEVTDASRGSVKCPGCRQVVRYVAKAGLLTCFSCGWECSWPEYHKTYRQKQLHAGSIEAFVRDFVVEFPAATSEGARLILIDTLIHRYHGENQVFPTRAGAANLIERKLADTLAFLDQLSFGDTVPPEILETRRGWHETRRRSGEGFAKLSQEIAARRERRSSESPDS